MKKDFSHLEKYRDKETEFASPAGATYGAFAITIGRLPEDRTRLERLVIICDDGTGPIQNDWEHVSVSVVVDPILRMSRIPTWSEMDEVKRLFWEDGEVVVQYHINDERKIHVKSTTLHLWRPRNGEFPLPEPDLV